MKIKKQIIVGIYKLTCPNGKIYVGQSKNIYQRWKHYIKLRSKDQPKLYNHLKEYGPENFKYEILEECLKEQLNEKETYWGNLLNVLDKDIGLNTGILGNQGKQSSESVEKRASKIRKPIIQFDLDGNFIKEHTSATQAGKELGKNGNNIADCASGKYKTTYGFIWEYKIHERNEEKRKEFVESLEHRSSLGSTRTQEVKDRMSQSTKGIKKHSEEFKKYLSNSKKGNKFRAKKVTQYDLEMNIIKIFGTFKEAKESINGSLHGLGDHIKLNSNKPYKKYIWRYE